MRLGAALGGERGSVALGNLAVGQLFGADHDDDGRLGDLHGIAAAAGAPLRVRSGDDEGELARLVRRAGEHPCRRKREPRRQRSAGDGEHMRRRAALRRKLGPVARVHLAVGQVRRVHGDDHRCADAHPVGAAAGVAARIRGGDGR